MRAVIYTRVSTQEQEHNHSLATQLEACRHYARQHGLRIVDEVQDSASGYILERAGLDQVRRCINEGLVEAVIVHSADRLSRNLAHMLLLREERTQQQVALHTVTRGESSASPESQLFDNIEGAFAEYERLRIRERLMRGARGKVTGSSDRPGRILGHGKAPYAYEFVGKGRERTIRIVPEEATIVRRIYRLYLQGETLRAIAQQLTAEGIPTPHDSGRYYAHRRTRPAGQWHQMVVWRVLRHEIYAGRLAHYRVTRTGKRGKREQRSKDEWVYVQVPAIIDEDTFQAVQQRIEQAQQRSRRNSKHFYLLGRGRLRCACGYAMNGTTTSAGKAGKPARRYYRCRANAADAVTPCALPRVNAERIEQAVWAWLESTLTPESIERGILCEQQAAHTRQPDVAAAMEHLTQRRAELSHEHERMIQAYKAGILSIEELARDKQHNDAALARIDAELSRLDQQQKAPCFDSEALTAVARQLQRELPHLGDEEKLHLLELLQVQVVRAADEQGQQWAHISCMIDAARLSVDGVLCHTPQQVTRCPLPG